MREILVYLVVAANSLFLMTFVVHMMVGGLVSEQTEELLTYGLCGAVLCLMGFMVWDVIRKRRGK